MVRRKRAGPQGWEHVLTRATFAPVHRLRLLFGLAIIAAVSAAGCGSPSTTATPVRTVQIVSTATVAAVISPSAGMEASSGVEKTILSASDDSQPPPSRLSLSAPAASQPASSSATSASAVAAAAQWPPTKCPIDKQLALRLISSGTGPAPLHRNDAGGTASFPESDFPSMSCLADGGPADGPCTKFCSAQLEVDISRITVGKSGRSGGRGWRIQGPSAPCRAHLSAG